MLREGKRPHALLINRARVQKVATSVCWCNSYKNIYTIRESASKCVPLTLQVTACDEAARMSVQSAGGKLTRVYYTTEGIDALLHVSEWSPRTTVYPNLGIKEASSGPSMLRGTSCALRVLSLELALFVMECLFSMFCCVS